MCRFIAYAGNPILLHDVLYKPKNSLIQQSIHAREAVDEPLNGDGFGVGWYTHEIDRTPGVFVSLRPAWNDRNLIHLASKIRSNCFFAHVRAASAGDVSTVNTHPFYYKRFLFMHNGDIAGFRKIKRYLRRGLSDELYDWVQGQTDSEHMFGLFADIFNKRKRRYIVEDIATTLAETIHEIRKMQEEHNVEGISYINAAITDGNRIVAVRYISDPESPAPTLYYAAGDQYLYRNGVCHITPTEGQNGAVLIVSEKLTNHKAEWHEIPVNNMILVTDDLKIELRPVD